MGSIAARNGGFYSFLGWANMGDKHWFKHKVSLEIYCNLFQFIFWDKWKNWPVGSLQILGLSSYGCLQIF